MRAVVGFSLLIALVVYVLSVGVTAIMHEAVALKMLLDYWFFWIPGIYTFVLTMFCLGEEE